MIFRLQGLTLSFGGVWILATRLKETGCGVKETKNWASTSTCTGHADVCNYSRLSVNGTTATFYSTFLSKDTQKIIEYQ